jgi:A/G-specific adenine glycosylase
MKAEPGNKTSFPNQLGSLRRKLLVWYNRDHRDLPWRRTRDPYAIWIAETMLQQTQVKTVLPYYRRFLETFPTVHALDRASMERVLTLWSGLGYYRRARNLKLAARRIVREHQGKIPNEWHHLIALPGIGPYTAGALLSIAFNHPFPALDGNARRVLMRLFNPRTRKELAEVAHRFSHDPAPSQLNQALMELGATICLPRRPQCVKCPVSKSCHAHSSDGLRITPMPGQKRKFRKVLWPLLLIERDGKILLRRRAQEGLLAGLWEIPGGEKRRKETITAALTRHLDGLGNQVSSVSPIGEIRHSITNRRIRAPLFRGDTLKRRPISSSTWRWFSLDDLHRCPLSSLTRKAIRLAFQS